MRRVREEARPPLAMLQWITEPDAPGNEDPLLGPNCGAAGSFRATTLTTHRATVGFGPTAPPDGLSVSGVARDFGMVTDAERHELGWIRFRLGALAAERLTRGLTANERAEWTVLGTRELELLPLERADSEPHEH